MEIKKLQGNLTKKTIILNDTYELLFELEENISFIPGQYANFLIEAGIWRSFSIIEVTNKELKVIADLRIGGPGSIYLKSAVVGDQFTVILPLGEFVLYNTNTTKTFIATGTGITPILPMLKKLKASSFKGKLKLIYGIKDFKNNLLDKVLKDYPENLEIIYCVSQQKDKLPKNTLKGRVTYYVKANIEELKQEEIYIAGNPHMVLDTAALLKEAGITNFRKESY